MAELSVQQWIDDEQSGLGMDWEEGELSARMRLCA